MKFIKANRIFWSYLNSFSKSNVIQSRVDFLHELPFFQKLSKWQLKHIADIFYERKYEGNEFIFETGHPGAALFMVIEGRVSVEISNNNQSTQLAVLEKGAFFGELALLDDSPRSASARALVPTVTLALFRADLDKLIESEPEIASRIYKNLAGIVGERLKATNELVALDKSA